MHNTGSGIDVVKRYLPPPMAISADCRCSQFGLDAVKVQHCGHHGLMIRLHLYELHFERYHQLVV
jgi:hypothetical protein